MAGYYDPNKDYSKAISEAKAAGKDTSQLEAERQNKIDDKYGGKEPTMYGSNKTYSQASRDNDRDTISNAISIRNSRNNQSGGSSAGTSSGGAVTTPSTTWQPGILTKGNRPDTSKHPEYAGLSVKQGHYTVTYNERGYAVKAVNDDGASANATMKTTHANDSIYHQEAYQAAQRGDWDAVGTAINKIAMAEGKDQSGHYDMTNANRYYGELVNEFRYNANDYYNKRYDETFGAGSAAVWDATNGAIETYQQLVDAVGADMAQQIIGTGNTASGQMSIPSYGGGVTVPTTRPTLPSGNIGGWATGNTGGGIGGTGTGETGNTGNTGNTGYEYTGTDLTDYRKELYAKNLEAELANLKSTYDTNVADLEAQQKDIKQQFEAARNQTAAQYDLGRMRFNEYALANGLNTGTAGQGVLAQSAAYQGNLADIGSQEASAMSDNSLQLTKLAAQYNAAINEAKATGDFQLAQALYDELVRQENVAIQQQQAAQEQANWEKQFEYQQQLAAQSQSNWERQFAYQQQLDSQDYAMSQQQLAAQSQQRDYEYAMTLLSSGVMPDLATLQSAGISQGEAAFMQQMVLGSMNTTTTNKAASKAGGTHISGAKPVKTNTSGYNNGSLTTAQVKQLQKKLGVTADGKWGRKSSTAAGGLTADEAWAKYGGYDMSFEELKSTLTRYLSLGGAQRAQNILDAHWDSLTPAQPLELSNLFG